VKKNGEKDIDTTYPMITITNVKQMQHGDEEALLIYNGINRIYNRYFLS